MCLVNAMAMGGKKASKQRSPLGQREILQNQRRPELGLCRDRRKRRWNTKRGHIAERIGYAYTTACQDQSRRQSARPEMGAVLRVPVGQENAALSKRSQEALPRLAKARGQMPHLSGANHKGHPLGCPPHCEKDRGRDGCGQQSSDAPFQLP